MFAVIYWTLKLFFQLTYFRSKNTSLLFVRDYGVSWVISFVSNYISKWELGYVFSLSKFTANKAFSSRNELCSVFFLISALFAHDCFDSSTCWPLLRVCVNAFYYSALYYLNVMDLAAFVYVKTPTTSLLYIKEHIIISNVAN